MSIEHLKEFLAKIQQDKELFRRVQEASTANDIAQIALQYGYEFSGEELKAISKENIPGVRVKKQDTSPSYNFGESGN